jgi:hypothetical protein
MRKIVAVGVALVVSLAVESREARAQHASGQVSVWLQQGISGFGAEAGLEVEDQLTDFVVYGGYSHRGVLELNLALHYVVFDDVDDITDMTAVGIAPAIHYHPLKQSASMPISLGLDAELLGVSASSPEFEQAGVTLTGVQGTLGASVYRFIRLAPNIGVSPSAGLRFSRSVLTAQDEFDEEILRQTDNTVSLVLRGNFAFLDSRGTIYGLTPSLAVGEGVAFGLMFGMIWSLQRH